MQGNPYQAPSAEADAIAGPGPAQFRSLRGVQAMLTPLLVSYAVMEAVVAVATFAQPAPVDETAALTGADLLEGGMLAVYLLVALATVITFGRLLVRSNVNARSFGRFVKFSPASMVWWYFVPIASLFKPYEAFKTVWQASRTEVSRSDKHPQMPLWWGSWIVSSVLNNVSWPIPEGAAGEFALVSATPTIAACYFAIVVTRALTERQERAVLALKPELIPNRVRA